MQSQAGILQIENTHRGQLTATISRSATILVTAIILSACLSACSLLDSKSMAGNGEAGTHGSTHEQNTGNRQTLKTARSVEALGADQPGLESVVEQLIDEQKTYEARLQALEAIILHGHTVAPVPAGYLNPGTPASSAATTEQLASLPIEPEVNTRPMTKRASPEKTRVSSIVRPAEQNRPVKEQAPSRPQPAGTSGSWVINLGSYSRKKVADRMLAEFLQQDVAAEQIKVVVNDATMYRVRVAGFDTRQAAMQHTQYLQEQLGIADIWITGN